MKRGLTALGALAAVFALGACSDDDGNNLDDVTIPDEIDIPDVTVDVTIPDVSIDVTTPDLSLPDVSDITLPDISVPEDVENFIRNTFPDLTETQVDCLVSGVSGDNVQMQDILDLTGECNVSLQDLVPG